VHTEGVPREAAHRERDEPLRRLLSIVDVQVDDDAHRQAWIVQQQEAQQRCVERAALSPCILHLRLAVHAHNVHVGRTRQQPLEGDGTLHPRRRRDPQGPRRWQFRCQPPRALDVLHGGVLLAVQDRHHGKYTVGLGRRW